MISFVVGQIVIGWLLADLASGIFHWVQDRVIPEDFPVLGWWLAAFARLHHREPLTFTKRTFRERNQANVILAVTVGAILMLLVGPSILLATMTIGAALSAQVHYWTHKPHTAPRIVSILQEIGALQSPKHHAGHHRPPHTKRYCALTDWLNPILDNARVWSRLERRPA